MRTLLSQVISEIDSSGGLQRGYVYLGNQLLSLQTDNQVSWVHQDPITKSQRITNSSCTVTSTIDLDPWGGETSRSSNQASQPHRYTSYERDGNGGDEAMMRRYNGKWHRFMQPDPSDGSYDLTNPQSFNRYTYVQNDPANLVDPRGLDPDGGVLGTLLGPISDMGPSRSFVTVFGNLGGPTSGPGSLLGGDAHDQLLLVLLHEFFRGGPQDPVPSQEISDCIKFAEMVRRIAGETLGRGSSPDDLHNFMNRLATTFT